MEFNISNTKLEDMKTLFLREYSECKNAINDFYRVVSVTGNEEGCFIIPFYIKASERSINTLYPGKVEFGKVAIDYAFNFLSDFSYEESDSQDTKKMGGVIQTGLDREMLKLHVTRINRAKSACKSIVTKIVSNDAKAQADLRFYFIREICNIKNLVTKELYRNFIMILDPVDSFGLGLEKHGFESDLIFPKIKATLVKDDKDIGSKLVVLKRHNSTPLFIANNSLVRASNKNSLKQPYRCSYIDLNRGE